MSNQAITEVLEMKFPRSSYKFVLLCMANYAGKEMEAYPSVQALSADTCLDRKTVLSALSWLQDNNYITDTGERRGRTGQVIVYRLTLQKSPKNGTVPKTEQSQNVNETVPLFPTNSTVFSGKESQKRDTDTSGYIIESSMEPSRELAPRKADTSALDAVEAWNDLADELKIPRVQRLSDTREKHLCARLSECRGLTGWDAVLAKIRESMFLSGKTEKRFVITFDWVINKSNFLKIVEGNYDRNYENTAKPKLSAYEQSLAACF